MGVHPVTNDRWGFASNCFVCEPRNETGLRIPFFHDDERAVVFADFTLSDTFSGAPNYVHGGVTLAILDEAMAWAAIAVGGRWAVTRETTTTFERPVRVGVPYRVEARVEEPGDTEMACAAEVRDARSVVRARARATFTVLGAAQAVDATGADLDGDNRGFVR